MSIKIYVFAIVLGCVLGTWVGDWLFCLVVANAGLAYIIFEELLERKYGSPSGDATW